MIISFPEGTDRDQPLQATDIDDNIIDLTDATDLRLDVWPFPREGASAVATLLTSNSGITVDDAALGEFTATFLADTLNRGVYVFEVGVTLSTGAVLMIGRGDLYVTESFLNG